jgi:protein CpxP
MKTATLVATVLFGACIAASAAAQDAPVATTQPPAVQRIERRLHITQAQREQVKAILKQEQPKLQQLHRELLSERSEMAAASQGGSFNAVAVQSVASKYAAANADVLVERAKLHSELFAVLTPEQQQRLQRLRTRLDVFLDDRLQTLGGSL